MTYKLIIACDDNGDGSFMGVPFDNYDKAEKFLAKKEVNSSDSISSVRIKVEKDQVYFQDFKDKWVKLKPEV